MKLKVILLFTIVLAGCQPQPKMNSTDTRFAKV